MMRLVAPLRSFLPMVGSISPCLPAAPIPMRNVMSLLGGLAIAIAMASPAAADWVNLDYPKNHTYLATVASEDGRGTIQIFCKSQYLDAFEVHIFTGERYDPGTSYPDEVQITVTTAGRQLPVVYGSFKNLNGKLVVHSDINIEPAWYRVVDGMAASKSTINIQFDQREYRFSSKGLTAARRHQIELCS
jgi:hypothetical protein